MVGTLPFELIIKALLEIHMWNNSVFILESRDKLLCLHWPVKKHRNTYMHHFTEELEVSIFYYIDSK